MTRLKTKPAIEVHDVGVRFGRRQVLDALSFTIRENTVVGIAAPNGAGKSTIVSLLSGWTKPTRGTVSVLGLPPRVAAVRGWVGSLPQTVRLRADERVEAFVTYLARLSSLELPKVRAMLDRFELTPVAGMRCGELSGGMQRRVALAAALLGEPRVIVLDEPTAGLEPRAANIVRRSLRELRENATVLLTSPDPGELDAVCDEVLGLEGGRIAERLLASSAHPSALRLTLREDLNPSDLEGLDGLESYDWNPRTLTLVVRVASGANATATAHALLDALRTQEISATSVGFLNPREALVADWMNSPSRPLGTVAAEPKETSP